MSLRNIAMAFGIGALVALLVDAALQNALEVVRSPGVASMTPWWVIGHVFERSVWLGMALLVWLLAPRLAPDGSTSPVDRVVTRAAAADAVGRAMIVVPILWALATWLVLALKLTIEGTWDGDGRTLLSGYYYYNVLMAYVPWAAGGITLLSLRRHAA